MVVGVITQSPLISVITWTQLFILELTSTNEFLNEPCHTTPADIITFLPVSSPKFNPVTLSNLRHSISLRSILLLKPIDGSSQSRKSIFVSPTRLQVYTAFLLEKLMVDKSVVTEYWGFPEL